MRCKVCGCEQLIDGESKTGSIRASGIECDRCHALNLDDRTAQSDKDRDSVRRALAGKQRTGHPESGTQRTSAIGLAAAVDAVVSEVEVVLAELRVAHEFLAQMVGGELGKAVGDARDCVQRIETLMTDLGRRCERATRRELEATTKKTEFGR